jgi:hypothetical protein
MLYTKWDPWACNGITLYTKLLTVCLENFLTLNLVIHKDN